MQRALAVLYNGLGRYGEAMAAAQRFCDQHPRGGTGKVLMELVEASSRSGEHDVAAEAFQRLRQRTRNGGTDWALGLEATANALLNQGQVAEDLYGEAIDRLGRCRMRMYLAARPFCTVNGCAVSIGPFTPANSFVPPTACSTLSGRGFSPKGHKRSCRPPAGGRRRASVAFRTSSHHRKPGSPVWPVKA